VVLKKVLRGGKGAVILDPAVGERRLSLAEISRHFTGVALELSPNTDFQPEQPAPRVRLSAFTGKVRGLKRSLLQIFAVALVLQAFAIVAPLLKQLVIDDVLASGDRKLLSLPVLGFGLLLVVQTAIGLARTWMVKVLGQTLALQWTGKVFAHLVRLPVGFFERRHLSDITSRFGVVGANRHDEVSQSWRRTRRRVRLFKRRSLVRTGRIVSGYRFQTSSAMTKVRMRAGKRLEKRLQPIVARRCHQRPRIDLSTDHGHRDSFRPLVKFKRFSLSARLTPCRPRQHYSHHRLVRTNYAMLVCRSEDMNTVLSACWMVYRPAPTAISTCGTAAIFKPSMAVK